MPSLRDQVQEQQQKQETQYDRRCTNRSFQQGTVLARNFRQGSTNDLTWLPEKILKPAGPLSYDIKLSNDQIIRRYTDHIHPSEVNSDDRSTTMSDDVLDDVQPFTTCQPPTPCCRRSQRDRHPPEHFQA